MNDKPNFVVGRTCVRVMKKEINERTKKETILKIHEGIVVQNNNDAFVRVYSNAPLDKGGDVSPETSELFPVTSKCLWVEVTNELVRDFPIPPALR